MSKHKTRKLAERSSDGADKAGVMPSVAALTSGSHSSSSIFPTSTIVFSSVSAPLVPSLKDSHRQAKRSKLVSTDKKIHLQNNKFMNKINNNLNSSIRTNILVENKHCSNDRVGRLLLRHLKSAQNTGDYSTMGSNPNRFKYSDDMSRYERNSKLQLSRKHVTSRISEKKQESNFKKSRKRLSKLLHTHAALILLSVLVVMDATCVIGQLLADIFIVKVQLEKTEVEKENFSHTLQSIFPSLLNRSDQTSLEEKLHLLKENLEEKSLIEKFARYFNSNDIQGVGFSRSMSETRPNSTGTESQAVNMLPPNSMNVESKSGNASPNPTADALHSGQGDLLLAWQQFTESLNEHEHLLKQAKGDRNTNVELTEDHSENGKQAKSKNGSQTKKSSSRKTGGHKEVISEEHILLEVTHIFHMSSLTILSILLLETLLKVFAMGRKVWNHKLEVFDAAIIIISWSLDLVFKDGIWDHPGSSAATILIILLPWRVMRIVNSFVLVIQEKDNVRLKLLKHRYRSSERRTRECKEKLNKYRVETKSLQGVCRKFGVPEGQITACMPIDKRGRSNLPLTALSQFASLAMVSSVGSLPNLATKSEYSSDSSTSDEDELIEQHRGIDRTISADSAFSQTNSIFSTVSFAAGDCPNNMGEDNIAFSDETMGNTSSLPTYEDAMILVINSNAEVIHTQNHHTKL